MKQKQYTKEEIEQKIKELNNLPANNEKVKNVFTHWTAWLIYGILLWLGIELLLKLKSFPYIGAGIVAIIVLYFWGLPALKQTIKQNAALRKSNKEKDKQIIELTTMLRQLQ